MWKWTIWLMSLPSQFTGLGFKVLFHSHVGLTLKYKLSQSYQEVQILKFQSYWVIEYSLTLLTTFYASNYLYTTCPPTPYHDLQVPTRAPLFPQLPTALYYFNCIFSTFFPCFVPSSHHPLSELLTYPSSQSVWQSQGNIPLLRTSFHLHPVIFSKRKSSDVHGVAFLFFLHNT